MKPGRSHPPYPEWIRLGKLLTENIASTDITPQAENQVEENMLTDLLDLAEKDFRVTLLGQGFPGDPTGASKRAQDMANDGDFLIGISRRHIVFLLPDRNRKDKDIRERGPACGGGNTDNTDHHISDVWIHFNWNPHWDEDLRSYPYYFDYNIKD